MKNDEKFFHEYDSIFRAQVEAGVIECVPVSEKKFEGAQFLPHHGVLRDDRQTTKLRIVFDGSARADQNQYSLNDCLEKGPNLTPHIFDVLTKFRGYPVGLIADIEKAFHQISVNPADRDKLRFLWFKNIEGENPEIVQYRFCRLVFGLTSSPAILNGTVQNHLSQYKQSEPQVAELLVNSLYVDDFPGGASDDESAFHVYQKGKSIMHEGGFNLRKWSTSSSVLNQRICKEEGQDEHEPVVKILGLNWNTVIDAFHFDFAEVIEYIKSLPPTKRSVLKCSAKLFDPLGLISPFTVNLKMWFQKLCSDKADWDDRSEGELLKKWNLLGNKFESMAKINVPR